MSTLDDLRALSDAATPRWDHDNGSGRLRSPAALFYGPEEQASTDAAFAVAAVKYVRADLTLERDEALLTAATMLATMVELAERDGAWPHYTRLARAALDAARPYQVTPIASLPEMP